MSERLTKRNEFGDAVLCDRLQGIGICLNNDVERVAAYEDLGTVEEFANAVQLIKQLGCFSCCGCECEPKLGEIKLNCRAWHINPERIMLDVTDYAKWLQAEAEGRLVILKPGRHKSDYKFMEGK